MPKSRGGRFRRETGWLEQYPNKLILASRRTPNRAGGRLVAMSQPASTELDRSLCWLNIKLSKPLQPQPI